MKKAIESLPCVEPASVTVDFEKKEARFTVKKDSKCTAQEVKDAVADTARGKVAKYRVL